MNERKSRLLNKAFDNNSTLKGLEKEFTSINELVDFWYGGIKTLRKDSDLTTGDGGAYNYIYGARAWANINDAANTLGALPKKPWDKSGYRAKTSQSSTATPGISEAGNVPATVEPTYTEVDVDSRVSAHAFAMSMKAYALQGKDDIVSWDQLLDDSEQEFRNRLNRAILQDNDTTADTDMESLDRICGSYSEISGVGQDAGDLDIYGVDRDAAASWVDAYVDHNSGVARNFSLDLMSDMFADCPKYWDNGSYSNKLIVTGHDTAEEMQQLAEAQKRYIDTKLVQVGVNGVQTAPGDDAGFSVATYRGIPIIRDGFVPQDTLSRIYLLDMDYLHLGTLMPVQYVESPGPHAHNKMTKEAMYFMMGEVVCLKFPNQGKIRDLQ